MTRGKCEACGLYAYVETVEVKIAGKVYAALDLCRGCASTLEIAVDRIKRGEAA